MKTMAMQPGLLAGYGLIPVVKVEKGKVRSRMVREARTCDNIAAFDARWARWQADVMSRMADAPEGIEPRLIGAHEAGCYV